MKHIQCATLLHVIGGAGVESTEAIDYTMTVETYALSPYMSLEHYGAGQYTFTALSIPGNIVLQGTVEDRKRPTNLSCLSSYGETISLNLVKEGQNLYVSGFYTIQSN